MKLTIISWKCLSLGFRYRSTFFYFFQLITLDEFYFKVTTKDKILSPLKKVGDVCLLTWRFSYLWNKQDTKHQRGRKYADNGCEDELGRRFLRR